MSTPTEWLDLNDGVRYTLEARRQRPGSDTPAQGDHLPHVPGQLVISAQPDNVTENVVVWVNEFDHFALWKAVDARGRVHPAAVHHALAGRPARGAELPVGRLQITTDQPLMHATMAKFTVRVPRHPQVVHARWPGCCRRCPAEGVHMTANGTFTLPAGPVGFAAVQRRRHLAEHVDRIAARRFPTRRQRGLGVRGPTETIDQATMVSVATGYERVFTSRVAPDNSSPWLQTGNGNQVPGVSGVPASEDDWDSWCRGGCSPVNGAGCLIATGAAGFSGTARPGWKLTTRAAEPDQVVIPSGASC